MRIRKCSIIVLLIEEHIGYEASRPKAIKCGCNDFSEYSLWEVQTKILMEFVILME